MIKATNIEKSYGGEKVLHGVSLSVKDGEFVSIMGESGSGKTTLLNILAGFLLPDAGSVLWDGQEISKMNEKDITALRCEKMGFVFQSYQLIPTLNVKDNLLLPTILSKKYGAETENCAKRLIEELELSALLEKYPDELSGGQCQRVAILRALIPRPRTVILDEPTGALDSRMEERVMALLSRINRENKTTVIQVTHSDRVAAYGSRTVLLKDGEIL